MFRTAKTMGKMPMPHKTTGRMPVPQSTAGTVVLQQENRFEIAGGLC
jgi:hypothetical protein